MYVFVLLFVTVLVVVEYIRKKEYQYSYFICWIILTAMICFRYGQGTDYPTYERAYYYAPYGEVGYRYLGIFFRKFGFSFPDFVFVLSLCQMLMLNRYIQRYSKHKILSLMFAYHTLYLTYYFSGIRQGVAVAIFLGCMIHYLEKDKNVKYVLAGIVTVLFHTVSVVIFVLPFVKKVKLKNLLLVVVASALFGILPLIPTMQNMLISMFGEYGYYYLTLIDISVMGISERIVMFSLISFMYFKCSSRQKTEKIDELLYKIYIVGFAISLACVTFSMVSSRVAAPFKAVEIVLITRLIYKQYLKKVFFIVLIGYIWVFTLKNLVSYVIQGAYRDTNILNYPYITVFNKEKAYLRPTYAERGIPNE